VQPTSCGGSRQTTEPGLLYRRGSTRVARTLIEAAFLASVGQNVRPAIHRQRKRDPS
jgi:hypothetical protein